MGKAGIDSGWMLGRCRGEFRGYPGLLFNSGTGSALEMLEGQRV